MPSISKNKTVEGIKKKKKWIPIHQILYVPIEPNNPEQDHLLMCYFLGVSQPLFLTWHSVAQWPYLSLNAIQKWHRYLQNKH